MTGFTDHFYDSADGLRLHARIYGQSKSTALPVICLPGLTRNARDFHRLALMLSGGRVSDRQVIAFDYRGRGESAYAPDWNSYSVGTEFADVLAGLASLGIERASFIGTSRGGLILQVMAAFRPQLIHAAVLNDIGPEIEKEGLDLIRAYLANPPAEIDSLEAAAAQQKSIHGPAFPALSDQDWQNMAEAIYRVENGRPVLDFDPALVNTLTVGDPNAPLPTLWKEFDALAQRPVLVLRGENSRLLSAAISERMKSRGDEVEVVTVAGQGHAPFLETGDLPQRIAAFFDRVDA